MTSHSKAQVTPFKHVNLEIRINIAKKLDLESDRDWRLVAHHLGFKTEDITWIPKHVHQGRTTNTLYFMEIYEEMPGNCVEHMMAALGECRRNDVLSILQTQFPDISMETAREMLQNFKENPPPKGNVWKGIMGQPKIEGIQNHHQPMEMSTYANPPRLQIPSPSLHQTSWHSQDVPLDLTPGSATFHLNSGIFDPNCLTTMGPKRVKLTYEPPPVSMDTDSLQRQLWEPVSPQESVIKYARTTSRVEPEHPGSRDATSHDMEGLNIRGVPPRRLQSDMRQLSGSFPPFSVSKHPDKKPGIKAESLSVPGDLPLASHGRQPAERRIRVVFTYARCDRAFQKLMLEEKQALDKDFIVPCLTPSEDVKKDEIQRWITKSDFVVIFVSPLYSQVISRHPEVCNEDAYRKNANVRAMHEEMYRHHLQNPQRKECFIPVLLNGVTPDCVPSWLQGSYKYRLPQDRRDLHFRLNDPERILKRYVRNYPRPDIERVGSSLPVMQSNGPSVS